MDSIACENIDRVMNIEMRGPGTLPRGIKWNMYQMARRITDVPLTQAAALLLYLESPKRILIVSGAAVPQHMPVGENDGPLGSVVLARSLTALGHKVSILTDTMAAMPFKELIRACDIDVEVIEISVNDSELQYHIAEDNDVFCAIERLGGNTSGIIYGATGVSRAPFRANVDLLFNYARKLGKTTIGIADGGNEIGCGNIHQRLCSELPDYSFSDVTPCGGGVYSVVETDLLVISSTSNMGAYAITAGLALLYNNLSLCHTAKEETALTYIGVGLGLIDGGSGKLRPWCDGVPLVGNCAMIEMMHTIVAQSLGEPNVRDF